VREISRNRKCLTAHAGRLRRESARASAICVVIVIRCYCHRSLAGEVGRGGVLSLFFFSFHAFFQPCNAVD